MKYSICILISKICLFSSLLLVGCQGSSEPVNDLTIGLEGESQGYLGQTLPWNFSVDSVDHIEQIILNILPVEGEGWTFTKTYERQNFNEDGTIHDAIQIPDEAKVGNYRFELQLLSGGKRIYSKDTELTLKVDSSIPYISALDVGVNSDGSDLHLETDLSAPQGIESVTVDIHGEEVMKSFTFDSPRLKGTITNNFHEHIDVQEMPKGEYKVILTVRDGKGKQADASGSFKK